MIITQDKLLVLVFYELFLVNITTEILIKEIYIASQSRLMNC